MKRMKKFLIGLLACLSVFAGSIGLAACGGNDNSIDKGATENLHYQKIAGKEEYRVIGLGLASELDIIISSTYKGLPVTEIDQYAFRDCDRLESVEISDSVTSIGKDAFCNCDSLTNIKIGGSVTSIGYAAFGYCDSLTSIAIGESVSSIGDYAFASCSSLTSITFNGTIEEWNAIEKDYYGWKAGVPATKVVCLDGEVAI